MRIDTLIDEFLAQCRQGLSKATVAFYRGRLRKFRERFGERDFATLKLSEIVDYLEWAGTGASDSTRRHNIVALERLQLFARERRVIRKRIFPRLKKPPIALREKLPTAEEREALLREASAEFKLIYAALRQCGARPSELCGALIEQIQTLEGGRALVLTKHKTARKTGKPRIIPIGNKLGELIAEGAGDRTAGPIFRSPRGTAWTPANLSATYRSLRDAAGLPKHLCLYLARHEHASEMVRRFDIHAAKEALGHSSINTTQRYVHTKLEDKLSRQDAFGEEPSAPPGQASPRADDETKGAA
jgi:integrase